MATPATYIPKITANPQSYTTNDTLSSFLAGPTFEKFISILGTLAGALAVIFLIWYGIQYITSNGNPDKAKIAKNGIINVVIGIIIVVASYFIIKIGVMLGNTINSSTNNSTTISSNPIIQDTPPN